MVHPVFSAPRRSPNTLVFSREDELMKTLPVRTICTAAVLAGFVALSGCSRDHTDVSYRGITNNLTPELRGLHERPVDVSRNMRVAKNQNWRMFSDDLGRVFYTDHPSRLTPMPMVDTSGNPR